MPQLRDFTIDPIDKLISLILDKEFKEFV